MILQDSLNKTSHSLLNIAFIEALNIPIIYTISNFIEVSRLSAIQFSLSSLLIPLPS